jgi:branched-chain amino acid transport system substrate-binding protein
VKQKICVIVAIQLIAVILVTALAAGCTPKPQQEEIVIGVVNEMTGFMSPAAIPNTHGIQTMLEMQGAQVDGRPIKLVIEDTACDPAMAVDKVKKLVEFNKACMIVGPLFGGTFVAMAPYLNTVHVPDITVEANWENVVLDNDWSWIVSGGLIQSNYSAGTYAYEAGYRTATCLFPESSGGPDFYEGFRRSFTELGGTIVQDQWFGPDTKDFSPYIMAMKPADVLFVFPVGELCFNFYKTVRELNFTTPIVGSPDEMGNPAILAAMGGGPPNLAINAAWVYTYDTPENKEFVAAYQKDWGELPGMTSGAGASAMQVALEALKMAGGDTSGQALAEALGKIDIDTIRGRITMTPDRVGTVPWVIIKPVQASDGTWTYEIIKRNSVVCKRVGDTLTNKVVPE